MTTPDVSVQVGTDVWVDPYEVRAFGVKFGKPGVVLVTMQDGAVHESDWEPLRISHALRAAMGTM